MKARLLLVMTVVDSGCAPAAQINASFAVASTSPADGSVGVPVDAMVVVAFSDAVDDRSIDDASFRLIAGASLDDRSVDSNYALLDDSTVGVTPTAPFDEGQVYMAVIAAGVAGTSQGPLGVELRFDFETVGASDTGG